MPGAIIMSRTDIVDEKKAMESMELLRSINEKAAIITTQLRNWTARNPGGYGASGISGR